MKLLVNQENDTDGTQGEVEWKSGIGTVICEGTFDGATVKLEAQIDDGEWVACGDNTTFTEAGMANLELGYGFKLRGSVETAGALTDITLTILRLR